MLKSHAVAKAVLAIAAVLLAAVPAAALTANLITAGSLVSKTPGNDLRIGTVDDTTVASPSGVGSNDSGPNTHGAASFALLRGSAGAPFPTWGSGSGFDYLLFVDGTITFTTNYNASTPSDLVLDIAGCAMRSTAEFNYNGGNPGGRGEAMTAGCSGTAHFNPGNGAGSVVLSGTFSAPFDSFALANQTLTADPGRATIVRRSQFGTSGNAYVDTVLAPLVPASATAIVLVEFKGRTNEATHQDWASVGVLAAYTTDDLGCTDVFPSLMCPGGGGCTDAATCETALRGLLPDPAAVSRKSKATATRLRALEKRAANALARARGASRKRQTHLFKQACTALKGLLRLAQKADAKHRLGVPLGSIQSAVTKLEGFVPACQ